MIGEAWQSFVSETAAWGAHAVFLRLLIATLVGLAIGIDREFHNKGAGIKLSPKLKPYFQWVLPILIVIILLQGLL